MSGSPSLVDVDTICLRLYGATTNAKRQMAYRLVREFGMPAVKLGRAIRFDLEQVEEWIRQGGTATHGSVEA